MVSPCLETHPTTDTNLSGYGVYQELPSKSLPTTRFLEKAEPTSVPILQRGPDGLYWLVQIAAVVDGEVFSRR